MSDNTKNKNVDFDATMTRLEKITDELSREGIGLEEALKLYEEGVSLLRICNNALETTEQKIKMLQITEDGELLQTDFANEEI